MQYISITNFCFPFISTNSFERGNDLLNENLSERMYREVFLHQSCEAYFKNYMRI